MDQYGIGSAMQAMQAMYVNTARRAGRTTSMLQQLKDGDRVICSSQSAQRDIKNRAQKMGLKIECIHLSDFHDMATMPPTKGMVYLDHTMVERLYEVSILCAQNEIDSWLERVNRGKESAHPVWTPPSFEG